MFLYQYQRDKDKGAYNYCVEWNYDIYREDLLWKCWNIKEGRALCSYQIDPSNDRLFIYDYYNSSDYISYPCTEYAKTIEIESNETPEFEDIRI